MNDLTEISEHDLIANRREKLSQMRKAGNAFPNDFRRDALAGDIFKQYDACEKETLEASHVTVKLAGRIMLRRIMGKASFVHIQDMSGKIQVYLRQEDLGEAFYESFKHFDLGDIIGVEGFLFRTKTNELTVHATSVRMLTKSLQPLPEKFHGLNDQEICYRQRYVDLIMNPKSRETFVFRSKIVQFIRTFLQARSFMEVETPMMQSIPGGANAKPFITHHHALNMELFMRIAPELFLKRLVVGGFERVFEINRNFRNEGISTQHNPEFTMIEFYQAYADYHDLMDLTETLFREIAMHLHGKHTLTYQGNALDFSKPFERLSMKNAVLKWNSKLTPDEVNSRDALERYAKHLGIEVDPSFGIGRLQAEIFDQTVEHHLVQPTFITEYPTEISPLARTNDIDPNVTDRFELFICGFEIANGFSELNDAEDQAERFRQQVEAKSAGDEEAMHYDADFVTALEYGLPPTAGEGIGIDRLAMIFSDSASIRDVILFPLMRPKA